MYRKLLEKIREYDRITIFRHQKPDGDAVFSVLALHQFLKDNFPEKKVKCYGNDLYSKTNKNDRVSDSFIRSSLAIVVDTSTLKRVDDGKVTLAPFIIKIDHHPAVDDYGDLNYVDTDTCACCEHLANIFMSRTFRNYILSGKTCEYLYCGMITDSLNFRTASTTHKTMRIASLLAEKGDLKISDLVEYLMDSTYDEYQKITRMRSYLKIREKFGYIILEDKDLKKIGFDAYEAKNNIREIGSISDLNVWAFAVKVDGRYDVSCRSKRGYIINGICHRYRGGGHANAAGVKQLSKKELKSLFDELIELSTKKPQKQ